MAGRAQKVGQGACCCSRVGGGSGDTCSVVSLSENAGLEVDHCMVLYVAVFPEVQSRLIRQSARSVTQYPVYRATQL